MEKRSGYLFGRVKLAILCLLFCRPAFAGVWGDLLTGQTANHQVQAMYAVQIQSSRQEVQNNPGSIMQAFRFVESVHRVVMAQEGDSTPELGRSKLSQEALGYLDGFKEVRDPITTGFVNMGKALVSWDNNDRRGAARFFYASLQSMPTDPGLGYFLEFLAQNGDRTNIAAWCKYVIGKQTDPVTIQLMCRACIDHGDGMRWVNDLHGAQFSAAQQIALSAKAPGSLKVDIVNRGYKPANLYFGQLPVTDESKVVQIYDKATLIRFLDPGDTIWILGANNQGVDSTVVRTGTVTFIGNKFDLGSPAKR
jgi:hypothetical protein